ncbi:uncharacterized protein LOC135925964 [Gordionus sp. m RMFG-2023]|uniref:uncharacterized protein LOC135925964 n=1 Tax=Gordionus sp. m RMFG-2023 TaxID=3053472 RepID=UPI0031FCE000
MRRCLMYHTDLTLRNVVELAYILYINLQEARRSGKFRQDIQVSVNSNRVTNKEDIQREIVSNVCNLQQRYPCVTPRTIMMYCLDLFKKFQEGPLIPLSSRIDGSTNYGNLGGSHFGNLGDGMQSMGDNAELMGALNDLKNSTRDLKHNAERFDDLMHILDRKGDLAKVAIKKVQPDKTIKLSQHKSRTNKKGKDQKINKEYIIEYFKNEKAESPYYGGGSPGAYEKDYVYEAETAPAPKEKEKKKKKESKKWWKK